MHYHTSEKEFYVDGCLCPEPEESLEQLEAMYAEACEHFRSLPMEVSDEDFDEDDDEAISEGMARFNLCNYIDALEWKIDLKILHRYKG